MINVNTLYSKKLLRSFEIFHFFRKSIFKSVLNIILIISLIVPLYLITGVILSGLYFQLVFIKNSEFEATSLIDIIGLIIFAMILPIIYFILCKRTIKHLKRDYRIEEGMKVEYEFGENEVEVSLSTPFESDSFIYNYKSIDKIYETSKYFYIYLSEYDLFILAKENLTDTDIWKLEDIFNKNLSENKFVRI